MARARYQIVPSPRGIPAVQLDLSFRRDSTLSMVNPDMTLAVLLDRSGSMQQTFNEGHVTNVATVIYNHVAAAGAGFDLMFYDHEAVDAGHMRSLSDVQYAVRSHPPRGSTYVAEALRQTIRKYRTRNGLYIIVITDGEFADKNEVLQLVTHDLIPQVTPENPYAFRLHFVGAGEGVDHQFLQQIENAATGQGVPLVTQHHHAHLSHSHASILDEMDKSLIGVGVQTRLAEPAHLDDAPSSLHGKQDTTHEGGAITTVVDNITRRTWSGGVADIGFLPRTAIYSIEYSPSHPPSLPVDLRFNDSSGRRHDLLFPVPLPKNAPPPGAQPAGIGGLLGKIHLPWLHKSPEEQAARAEAQALRDEVARLAVENHEAELKRQSADLQALAHGGIPSEAVKRLKEIGQSDAEGILFTSDFSPEEAALLRREGYRVRGIVGGSAVYHVGQAYASAYSDCEVTVLSQAYDEACRLAVSRMGEELRLIRGHGVVGVRFSMVRHEWAEKTVEVQVIGTAVEGSGPPPAEPWMCDMSGQEWWSLHRAGYEAAGLVWGHCTWFVLTTQTDEWNERSFQNLELTHWSAGLSQARHVAMRHLKEQAKAYKATGVCGVKIERKLDEVRLTGPDENPAYEREHHNIVLSIIGTAIRLRANAPRGVTPTLNVLSLRDGRLSPVGIGAQDAAIE